MSVCVCVILLLPGYVLVLESSHKGGIQLVEERIGTMHGFTQLEFMFRVTVDALELLVVNWQEGLLSSLPTETISVDQKMSYGNFAKPGVTPEKGVNTNRPCVSCMAQFHCILNHKLLKWCRGINNAV